MGFGFCCCGQRLNCDGPELYAGSQVVSFYSPSTRCREFDVAERASGYSFSTSFANGNTSHLDLSNFSVLNGTDPSTQGVASCDNPLQAFGSLCCNGEFQYGHPFSYRRYPQFLHDYIKVLDGNTYRIQTEHHACSSSIVYFNASPPVPASSLSGYKAIGQPIPYAQIYKAGTTRIALGPFEFIIYCNSGYLSLSTRKWTPGTGVTDTAIYENDQRGVNPISGTFFVSRYVVADVSVDLTASVVGSTLTASVSWSVTGTWYNTDNPNIPLTVYDINTSGVASFPSTATIGDTSPNVSRCIRCGFWMNEEGPINTTQGLYTFPTTGYGAWNGTTWDSASIRAKSLTVSVQ